MTGVLCTIGDLVEDVVVLLSGPPRPGSDVAVQVTRHRGGSAANVAAAAARLVGRSRFIGQVGADELGERLTGTLAADGVDVVARQGGRTGTIVALVSPDGERTMLSDRGAATQLEGADPRWLDGVGVLHVPAYSLAEPPLASTSRRLVDVAHDRGIAVAVDASSVAVLDAMTRPRDQLADLAPDVLFANREEAEHLGLDAPIWDGGWLVVKGGPHPTRLFGPSGEREEVAPLAATVVDTTGAGDAFAAGFLTAWIGGSTPTAATATGHRAAARVVTHPGSHLEDT